MHRTSDMSMCVHVKTIAVNWSTLGEATISSDREFQLQIMACNNECRNELILAGNCQNFYWWPLVSEPIGHK